MLCVLFLVRLFIKDEVCNLCSTKQFPSPLSLSRPPQLYWVVARVFWVVARWLIPGQSDNSCVFKWSATFLCHFLGNLTHTHKKKSLTHTHNHSRTFSLAHSPTPTHSHSLTHSRTHTHKYIKGKQTNWISLSLTHTHTHTHFSPQGPVEGYCLHSMTTKL